MKKLYLLDAYALIYRAYYGLIRQPRITSKGQNTSAAFGFVNTLLDILNNENPDYLGIAFDPKGKTFRHEAYEPYKAQRESTPEDIRWAVPVIKDIIEAFNIPILEVDGYEADDVIGTLAKKGAAAGLDVMMVTPDKDYAQLVEEHVTMCKPTHGNSGFERLGPDEVCAKYGLASPTQVLDLLALMGDSADNFPGCPGVGEKTAVKLINQFGSIDEMLKNADEIAGKLKDKVKEHTEDIKISKFLAEIKTDVPIELDLEKLERKTPDTEKLRKIFTELEFRTFLAKICGNESGENPGRNSGAENHENLAPGVFTPKKTYLIENETDARKACGKILTNGILGFSLQTSNSDIFEAKIVNFSFSNGEEVWKFQTSAENDNSEFFGGLFADMEEETDGMKNLVEAVRGIFENENVTIVGHNLKFILQILRRYDIALEKSVKLFDTMLAHYVIQPELHHDLHSLAAHYLNMSIDDEAAAVVKLMPLLENEMRQSGVGDVFHDIEMPLMSVLAKMEMRGCRIDLKALAETSKLFTERLSLIEKEIYALAGHEFVITSPKQVGEVLFDELQLSEKAKKTKSGQYATSEEILEALRPKHEIVGKILSHRALKKLLSTYIDALPKLVHPKTGHVHTSFNQAVTATGRLSSSNPNLQNIPVRSDNGKEIRKCFVPEPGEVFFSADYSQIELRLMAHFSGDAHMIQDFNDGRDIHAATAARIFKKDVDDVSKNERRKAKTANFGIIYGISAFGLAQRMEVDRKEAKELIDNYFATYPSIQNYIDKMIAEAREKGYICTAFGRRRYLPDINSKNGTVRGYAERNAVNAPIQGTAADIIKVAMVNIDKRIENEGLEAKMILQVHDELNFSVKPEELDTLKKIVTEEMEGAFKASVPLIADCDTGDNWLAAH